MSECCNAECRYAVCRYAERRYAECHYYFECLALERTNVISYEKLSKISFTYKSKSGL